MSDLNTSLRWLASPLSELIRQQHDESTPFDVVIIGSGYGGSVAAHYLTERFGDALRIVMLERGAEYLPGTFPADVTELPTHVRWSGTESTGGMGLFEFHSGPDINSITGNGLGGGSLINAGVMIRPDETFYDRLPVTVGEDDLEEHFAACLALFQAQTIDPLPRKFSALNSITHGPKAEPCEVTIS
ncbi:MAG: hypothetical protein AAF525_21910, partial [Pseudomonadota bacterium]